MMRSARSPRRWIRHVVATDASCSRYAAPLRWLETGPRERGERRVHNMRVFAVALCVSLVFAAPALAQFETASVVGTIRDTSGAVVPGAKVTLTNTGTGVSVVRTSNGEGTYEFVTVKSGTYVVTAEQTGFSIALIDNVQVQVGARLRVDLQMAVGQISERLEVTAQSPLIETD